ncbi:MAG: uncharacterized protein KVP18_000609 [Porospora cf. gigantea A]|uniref:uncharacterized protein n=1 Tax=Porospora cf. gigantea A TaxID=2853593 RepID=UPI00355ABD0E|nr:MAG: hypothetical protein KVP18_000609 [Porospora cf. gigantea A]
MLVTLDDTQCAVMVELRGDVQVDIDEQNVDLFHLQGNVLICGQQTFNGREEILPKPLNLLRKTEGGLKAYYRIQRKIVFDTRPEMHW